MSEAARRRRLRRLMGAGWIDSAGLAFAWTLLLLEVVDRHGLKAAGVAGAAMLVGTAASAPVASQLAAWLGGRDLLRVAAAVEAVLRVGVFVLLFLDVSLVLLALCIVVMNVTAWTGYAGMRAEVAAVAPGPAALTWYGTGVAATEALGAAVAALLPAQLVDGPSLSLTVVVAVYVLALVPTVVVAGSSPVTRVRLPRARVAAALRPSRALVTGVILMAVASGPTLLAVALTEELHGRSSVALGAVAFTVGALSAPALASVVERREANRAAAWAVCALGMVLVWPFAPTHVAVLCAAQLASGLFMTTLEGLLDATAAERAVGSVTGALARATAGRALGSAAGTALLPVAVVSVGLPLSAGFLVGVLAAATVVLVGLVRLGTRPAALPSFQPVYTIGRRPETVRGSG